MGLPILDILSNISLSLPMGLNPTNYFIRILEGSKIIAHFVQWLIGFNSIWPEIKIFYFICEALNVSSWDEEGLFVHPFIWQRNCKKRDLFNGSFSSQLRALVGCNGFSNDWDTLIHTDLNINCLVSSDYKAPPSPIMSHHVSFLFCSSEQSAPFLKVKIYPKTVWFF